MPPPRRPATSPPATRSAAVARRQEPEPEEPGDVLLRARAPPDEGPEREREERRARGLRRGAPARGRRGGTGRGSGTPGAPTSRRISISSRWRRIVRRTTFAIVKAAPRTRITASAVPPVRTTATTPRRRRIHSTSNCTSSAAGCDGEVPEETGERLGPRRVGEEVELQRLGEGVRRHRPRGRRERAPPGREARARLLGGDVADRADEARVARDPREVLAGLRRRGRPEEDRHGRLAPHGLDEAPEVLGDEEEDADEEDRDGDRQDRDRRHPPRADEARATPPRRARRGRRRALTSGPPRPPLAALRRGLRREGGLDEPLDDPPAVERQAAARPTGGRGPGRASRRPPSSRGC